MSAVAAARSLLREGLRLLRTRQRRAHLVEALAAAGAVALWASALTGSGASVWFGLALGGAWYLWRDISVVQAPLVGLSSIARWLDLALPTLEDSSTLVLEDEATGLRGLQRERVAQRLAALERSQLIAAMPMPPHRALPAMVLVGALGVLPLMLATPSPDARPGSGPGTTEAPVLERVTLEVTPPAYTRLTSFTDESHEVEVPQGAELAWEVLTRGAPREVVLTFDGGATVPLDEVAPGRWRSGPWRARSTAYRVQAQVPWLGGDRFRVLRVMPDRPPQFAFTLPARTVTELTGLESNPELALAVTVDDDYGLADVAARLTLASGGGENVRFREESLPLAPLAGGSPRERPSRTIFDLRTLGMEPGDELYVHLEARDNRQPAPNLASSRTWIVRWPAEGFGEQDDVGMMAMRVMPEYFRSQRQIIIDTEALMAAAEELPTDTFAARSQAIAIDQKALRLRYGTFLGEEAVTDIGPGVMPDEDDEPIHFPGDGHDHGEDMTAFGRPGAPVFGQLDTVLQQFGHTHDLAEQATLFDPQTRELLRAALAQMWDAELQLRLAFPDDALPFEYEALDLIKRVQQRSRIYLRRVGFRTTPPDEGRRFSGELDELALAPDARHRALPEEQALLRRGLTVMARLVEADGAAVRIPDDLLDELAPLLRAGTAEDPDLLNAIGALEALRTTPACQQCAAELAAGLLRLATPPTLPAQARSVPADPVARAYEGTRAGLRP